ncbi:MAG: PfkB family carbohydrate kinase, partial [Gemmatimonadota bacterium]
MSKVVVVGSLNQDVVVNVEAAPGPGETVLGRSLDFFQGGKGANQAVAARKSGARTVFVGRVGGDDFGRSLKHDLAESGIETRIAVDPDAPTGTAVILVDRNGENRIAVVL